jgi:thioredoxin 1
MERVPKVVVVAVLGLAIVVAVVGNRAGRNVDPDLRYLAATAGAHTDPVPASYGPSQAGVPRLVAIGAGECIPCKAMAPIRAEIRREYRGVLAVDFYDVWKDPRAAGQFGTRVIPTLIFFDAAGRELGRREGYVPKAEIMATWRRYGVRVEPTQASWAW